MQRHHTGDLDVGRLGLLLLLPQKSQEANRPFQTGPPFASPGAHRPLVARRLIASLKTCLGAFTELPRSSPIRCFLGSFLPFLKQIHVSHALRWRVNWCPLSEGQLANISQNLNCTYPYVMGQVHTQKRIRGRLHFPSVMTVALGPRSHPELCHLVSRGLHAPPLEAE